MLALEDELSRLRARVDRLEQARRPKRAEHRVDRLIGEQRFRSGSQPVRVALVLEKPLLEHGMDRATLPGGGMVGIDRIEPPQPEDRLGIESERVCLQPVDGGDRDSLGPLLRRGAWRGPVDGLRGARIVQFPRKALELHVVRQPPADGIEPQPEAGGHGRRSHVAPGPGDQHFGSAERAREIVRREADAELEARHPEIGADLWRKPRVGRRKTWPDAFVEPAQHNEVGLLQPGFEQAPDGDSRMPAVGRPDRSLVEKLPEQRHRVRGGDGQGLRRARGHQLGEHLGGHPPGGTAPGGIAGKRPGRARQ